MKKIDTYNSLLSRIVSMHAYVAATILVVYMVATFAAVIFEFSTNFLEMVTAITDQSPEASEFQHYVLKTLAFFIILYKAFRIFLSYGHTQHLNLKYVLEIAIIAPAIELIFNMNSMSVFAAAVMGTFAVAMATVYLLFYDTLRKVDDDFETETRMTGGIIN